MKFADVVAASDAVAATASRLEKVAALAGLLGRLSPAEVEPVVGFLTGRPRGGKVGVGWATVSAVQSVPAQRPSLEIVEVDQSVEALRSEVGPGSASRRKQLLSDLFGRATAPEADFLRRFLTGELRQGALAGVLTEAVARAAGVPADRVRRELMLEGDLGRTALRCLTAQDQRDGVTLMQPVRPMLASSSPSLEAAMEGRGPVSVEWKLDGIRIQAHRDGDEVRLWTRNLNDITSRLPGVAEAVLRLDARKAVLDGEAIVMSEAERPAAFQETMSRIGRRLEPVAGVVPFFFDCLHLEGRDLIDEPLSARATALEEAASALRMPGVVTDDPAEAEGVSADALAAGHEGVVVKDLDSVYAAGRRGGAWRKVKPVRTLDLVVLGAEWGHGRRRGRLSNLHLGARDPSGGPPVMVGKTFKGLTDALLEWQTEEFLKRETGREGIIVWVRPELVVEIALDGVQASTRYPGGVALRFARVRRYRPDKDPADADTIDAVQALL